jgi:signal transduction histidine kinase
VNKLVVGVPFFLGLGFALVWQLGLWENPVLYFRSDVGTLFLLIGIISSGATASGVTIWRRIQRTQTLLFANESVKQADSRRRFIRRLDHELKNPLTAIRAGLANLNHTDDAGTLISVRAQVDRLARLTADLRKLADLETKPLEQEPVDLSLLLNDLMMFAHERPEAKSCRLRLTTPQAPWPLSPISGDRDLLFLALHNLLDNALKFSRAGDLIEVRAFEDGPSVVIQVADTGPGVSEDDLPHLGEELYRGSVTRHVEGSGMGLALVHAIVARHNGTVTIRSRLGQGTVVMLRFPALREGNNSQ